MASTAQIAANRRNAAKSTGPKSDQGKARARLNALRHGANARIAIPVLPQEDPKELAERILQWTFELVPRNDVERTLVGHAARIDWQIDRAERAETAYLAARVHRQRDRDEATRLKQAHILGRELLDTLDPRERFGKAEYYEDMPAVFLARLEQLPEGCRWLLARWSEFRNLIDVRAAWSETDHYRFLRLMGKSFLEGMIDPAANRVFQAVDAIDPGQGRELWELFRNMKASSGPYFSGAMPWRRCCARRRTRKRAGRSSARSWTRRSTGWKQGSASTRTWSRWKPTPSPTARSSPPARPLRSCGGTRVR